MYFPSKAGETILNKVLVWPDGETEWERVSERVPWAQDENTDHSIYTSGRDKRDPSVRFWETEGSNRQLGELVFFDFGLKTLI